MTDLNWKNAIVLESAELVIDDHEAARWLLGEPVADVFFPAAISDERLDEIERRATDIDQRAKLGLVFHRQVVPELIAEVRRLRRENQMLSEQAGQG